MRQLILSILKSIAAGVGFMRALPVMAWYRLCCVLTGNQRAFSSASESLSRLPGVMGIYTRRAFYKKTVKSVGDDVHFGYMSVFSKPNVCIGDRVYIGRFCTIGLAELDDDAMLADGVQVLSGRHQHGTSTHEKLTLRDNELKFSKVKIGKGAWIGANAVVMANVGPGAIVGAGAVVVKPVAAGAKVAGVPAKEIGGNKNLELSTAA